MRTWIASEIVGKLVTPLCKLVHVLDPEHTTLNITISRGENAQGG